MLHFTDSWLAVAFTGVIFVGVYFMFAIGKISTRLIVIETKLNVMFQAGNYSPETARQFFGAPEK